MLPKHEKATFFPLQWHAFRQKPILWYFAQAHLLTTLKWKIVEIVSLMLWKHDKVIFSPLLRHAIAFPSFFSSHRKVLEVKRTILKKKTRNRWIRESNKNNRQFFKKWVWLALFKNVFTVTDEIFHFWAKYACTMKTQLSRNLKCFGYKKATCPTMYYHFEQTSVNADLMFSKATSSIFSQQDGNCFSVVVRFKFQTFA